MRGHASIGIWQCLLISQLPGTYPCVTACKTQAGSVSYMLLHMCMFPEVVILVAIAISQCCLAARLLMLRGMIGLSVRKYFKKVYINVLTVTIIAAVLPFLITNVLTESFLNFIQSSLVALISTGVTIYYVGCNKAERQFVLNKLYTLITTLNKT